jgi:hypothetical protein
MSRRQLSLGSPSIACALLATGAGVPASAGGLAASSTDATDLAELGDETLDRRSLLETTLLAVAQFDFKGTLDALGENAGLPANGVELYQELIDSYASAPGKLPSAVHCNDENPGGAPTLNGYPIECDRLEAEQFDNLSRWFAIGVVNRIDLTPASGAHCGNQRLVFANDADLGNGRMLMIIEAQVPNPDTAAGPAGCLPIAQFWRSLEAVDDPLQRGALLVDAFLDAGVPGVGPFMNAAHLTAGTGQIRTNNFNDERWTMREFELSIDSGQSSIVPVPVSDSPHGALWNDAVELPAGAACRANFLNALGGLLGDNPAGMTFEEVATTSRPRTTHCTCCKVTSAAFRLSWLRHCRAPGSAPWTSRRARASPGLASAAIRNLAAAAWATACKRPLRSASCTSPRAFWKTAMATRVLPSREGSTTCSCRIASGSCRS